MKKDPIPGSFTMLSGMKEEVFIQLINLTQPRFSATSKMSPCAAVLVAKAKNKTKNPI